ncbi:armadillo-type protein [Phycomyces nitens]|nr:armadillo-type protein [Phycomyces nitens]
MLAKTQFSFISKQWPVLKPELEESLSDKEPLVRAAALRFIEGYASSMDRSLTEDPESEIQEYVDWWKTTIGQYIQQTSLDTEAVVRAISCDCMGSISKYVFARLDPRIQTLLVTLILPLPRDEDPNVRAAACRTLGVLVLFPDLREDPLFVSDMASALMEQMNDKVINVRVRASWAQGNLCDALVLESEKQDFCIKEWVSTLLWADLVSAATTAALDNDKLRSNAVRALGSLLRITPCSYFDQGRIMLLLKNAMAALVKNIEGGTLKTRWNACHAASNMLRNPDFPIGYMNREQMYPWTTGFYRALCLALTQCKNFKVRINACLALTRPSLQAQYGSPDQLKTIVSSVLEAYKTCLDDKETEFQELGYKDQLKAKTIEALEHIEPWLVPELRQDVDCILLK